MSESRDRDRDRDDRRDRYRDRDRDNYKRKRDDEDRDRKYDRERDRDYERDRRDRDRRDDYDRRDKERDRRDRDRDRERDDKDRDDSSPKRRKSEEKELDNEGTTTTKRLPMDVEDLLKKKQEEESKTSKPVFLSKEERQKLALAKRAAEVEERMKVLEEQKKLRDKFFQEAQTALSDDKIREKERERDRERRDRERKEKERKDRENEKEKDKDKEKKKDTEAEKLIDPKELEQMKLAYLGQKKEKKKIIKPSEKFKFVFDWDEDEDTSKDLNPLYSAKPDIRPQFGRGLFGGIDPTEQLKDYEEKKKKIMTKTAMEADKPQKHWTEKELEEMAPRDWRIFLEDFNISTKGGNIPRPMRNWKEGNFRKEIYDAIEKIGYKTPTGIQMQAIPIALQGRDLIGIAETGSGKTAAFVIPMLEYIMKLPPMTAATELEGPYALILAPTRELAVQIEQDASKFATHCNIRTLCIVGGMSIEEQALQLRKGCEVVIATPGRLNDLIESRYLALNQCTYVVLDEADKMIDMGFESQVTAILDHMPVSNLKSEDESIAELQENDAVKGRYRTTIMYSATMPPAVEKLAKKYLRRPAQVIVGVVGRAVDRITQKVEFVKDDGFKMKKLVELLQNGPPPPIIVFVNHKKTCDAITKHIEKFGFRPTALHSGRGQLAREAAIEGFKAGKFDILIATDVAGRGIDVKGVTHVINYDMPKSIQDYTHRVGRTGRAGMEGLATSFLTNDDAHIFYDLVQMLRSTDNSVPQELSQHPASSVKPGEVDSKKRRDTIIYAKK